MPAMMMSSENRKYQFRRLTKSILRTRAGAGGVSTLAASTSSSCAAAPGCSSSSETSAASSASSSSESGISVPSLPAFISSGGSDTIHPPQGRAPEPAAGHDDRQQVMRPHDRGDKADADADPERDRKPLDRPRSDEAEAETGDDRR